MEFRRYILFLMVVSVSIVLPVSASGGQAEVDRFLREYPPAAEAIISSFDQLKGQATMSRKAERVPARIGKAEFAIDHGFGKVTILTKRPPADEETTLVFCAGNKSDFYITRPAASKSYSIGGIGELASAGYNTNFGRYLATPFTTIAEPLAKLMKNSTFRILSVHEELLGQKKCLALEYASDAAPMKHEATVILDPEEGWVIRRCEIRPTDTPGVKLGITIEYTTDGGRVPIPSLVTFVEPGSTSSCKFDWVIREGTLRDEFSLKYYNLPEIADATSHTSGKNATIYWSVGTAGIGLIAAMLLRRLAR